MVYKVDFLWDEDASVWIATSNDISGLVLESGSFDALVEKVKTAIPELLELNGETPNAIKIKYSAQREDQVVAYG